MCGIAGVVGSVTPENVAENMLSTMHRRGPDGHGIFRQDDCCLLHTRLAVIDPEGGAQPMSVDFGVERFTIVYNGELYNAKELRHELEKLGHCFLTNSDTEVVLRGYIQWKETVLNRLNGIFSFGIWEQTAKQLFLARDRIGVKPLFYSLGFYGICFASEIKTLLAHPNIPSQIDRESVYQILLLGPGRVPGSGVFRNIHEIKPGWYGTYSGGKFKLVQYWKLTDRIHRESLEETTEHIRYLVTDAIKRQMVSDVPIGTFLSGGLDSSLISAICAEKLKEENRILDTFSVGYMDHDKFFVPGKFQPASDDPYISIMEKYIGSHHKMVRLSAQDLIDELDNATIARDLPGMADVDFSLCAFCRYIRKDVKVALSGECADEIFGGYPWYRDPNVRSADGFPWSQNVNLRAQFIHRQFVDSCNPEDYVMDHCNDTIHQADILPECTNVERRMKEMVNLNFAWFMQTLLDRKDRMSMFHGLEVRVPFCDYRIAEYLYAVPWELKDLGDQEKGLLRYAMKGILPNDILYRKKSPYPKTFDPEYKSMVQAYLKGVMDDASSPLLQVVRKDALQNLLAGELTWPWYGQLMRQAQTMAYMLQINRWLQLYRIDIV